MIDTDKYEGHTPVWYLHGETGAWWVQSDFTTHDDFVVAEVRSENDADAQLLADAPRLLAEVERLREEVEQMRVLKILKENERLRERVATLESLMEYMADEEKVIE
tara:strand:+ start:19 stop:336 length:318 start_codon:yes stop_codon:yes gene_type:complete